MEEEPSFFEYVQVLLKRWKLILGAPLGVTLLAVLVSYFLTPFYKVEASLMPLSQVSGSGMDAAIAQMGLSRVMGGFQGAADTADRLLAILSSRTMAEKIMRRFNLVEVFYGEDAKEVENAPPIEEVIEKFRRHVFFQMNRTKKLVEITAILKSPQLAAEVANGCIEELGKFLKENSLTSAKRNRIFVENQLERTRAELLEAGRELLAVYGTEKISGAASTVDVDVSVEETPEGKETRFTETASPRQDLAALGDGGFFEGVPGVSMASAQMQEMQEKTLKIQEKADELKEKIKKANLVKDVPQQVYLQYLFLRKRLLGEANMLLTRQYQMARIHEAQEELDFNVIDYARVPVSRYRPNRKFIALATFMASLLGAIFSAFLLEYYQKKRSRRSAY